MNHYTITLAEEDGFNSYVHPSFSSMCYDVDEIAYHICVNEKLISSVYDPTMDDMYAEILNQHGITWEVLE